MRAICVICLIAFATATSGSAIAAKSKAGSNDMGSIRDKCRAEAQGQHGQQKNAMVRACVQRNKK
jgi:hypothetical protein